MERLGFEQVRQRDSHVVLKKHPAQGTVGCGVPLHRELAVGTLYSILKQAGVTVEDFVAQF